MKLSFVTVLALLLCSTAQAQQVRRDTTASLYNYKCHMQLEDGREVVRDYYDQPVNRNKNFERMLARETVAFNQGVRLAIVKVLECVELEANFGTAKARELDRETLR